METRSSEYVIEKFNVIYEQLINEKVIRPEYLLDYGKACKVSLHSRLQYALIRAGIECGFHSIPEYKVLLNEAIDKTSVVGRFEKAENRKSRKQWQVKADVAFIKGSEMKGLGEVYTLDEIHGCLSASELNDPWVSPYHKLHHLIHATDKPHFLVLVNVFPKKNTKKLRWKDSRRNSIGEWEKNGKNLQPA
jgi:hypothetical protein